MQHIISSMDAIVRHDEEFNGVISLSKNSQIFYEKAKGTYGFPKTNAQFFIGSISKQITAAILLIKI